MNDVEELKKELNGIINDLVSENHKAIGIIIERGNVIELLNQTISNLNYRMDEMAAVIHNRSAENAELKSRCAELKKAIQEIYDAIPHITMNDLAMKIEAVLPRQPKEGETK